MTLYRLPASLYLFTFLLDASDLMVLTEFCLTAYDLRLGRVIGKLMSIVQRSEKLVFN
jgi:hypothetical protein